MTYKEVQIYLMRWTILLLFMFSNIVIQILWISFAAVTSSAMTFYGVDELSIYLLSMTFMVVYIPVTFLASWVIDKFGFKIGAGFGALLAAIFGFLRIFAMGDFMLVLIFQIGIAIGQPFMLNSVTKLSANWFPESERTTATGISLISQFLGIALGFFITPFIVEGISFQAMLSIYGVVALISGLLFIIFVKDKPPSPPSKEISEEKVFIFAGLKKLFTNKKFLILVIVFLIGLGVSHTITIYIEKIFVPRGYDAIFTGIFRSIILIGGIIGCLVMSILSDKFKKREILIILSCVIATISLFIILFAYDENLLYLFGFLFGFGLISAAPVALEYAIDITSPVSEASSNGFLLMFGQIGGVIFILGFEGLNMLNGDYFPVLIIQSILLIVISILAFFLKEKKIT